MDTNGNQELINFYRHVQKINEDSSSASDEQIGGSSHLRHQDQFNNGHHQAEDCDLDTDMHFDFDQEAQQIQGQRSNSRGGARKYDRSFLRAFDNDKLHQDIRYHDDEESDLQELQNQLLDFDTGLCSNEDGEGTEGAGSGDLEAKINEQIRQDQFLLEKEQFKRQLMMGLKTTSDQEDMCDAEVLRVTQGLGDLDAEQVDYDGSIQQEPTVSEFADTDEDYNPENPDKREVQNIYARNQSQNYHRFFVNKLADLNIGQQPSAELGLIGQSSSDYDPNVQKQNCEIEEAEHRVSAPELAKNMDQTGGATTLRTYQENSANDYYDRGETTEGGHRHCLDEETDVSIEQSADNRHGIHPGLVQEQDTVLKHRGGDRDHSCLGFQEQGKREHDEEGAEDYAEDEEEQIAHISQLQIGDGIGNVIGQQSSSGYTGQTQNTQEPSVVVKSSWPVSASQSVEKSMRNNHQMMPPQSKSAQSAFYLDTESGGGAASRLANVNFQDNSLESEFSIPRKTQPVYRSIDSATDKGNMNPNNPTNHREPLITQNQSKMNGKQNMIDQQKQETLHQLKSKFDQMLANFKEKKEDLIDLNVSKASKMSNMQHAPPTQTNQTKAVLPANLRANRGSRDQSRENKQSKPSNPSNPSQPSNQSNLRSLKTQLKQEIVNQKQHQKFVKKGQEKLEKMLTGQDQQMEESFSSEVEESDVNDPNNDEITQATPPTIKDETQALELQEVVARKPISIHVQDEDISPSAHDTQMVTTIEEQLGMTQSQYATLVRQNIESRLPKLEDSEDEGEDQNEFVGVGCTEAVNQNGNLWQANTQNGKEGLDSNQYNVNKPFDLQDDENDTKSWVPEKSLLQNYNAQGTQGSQPSIDYGGASASQIKLKARPSEPIRDQPGASTLQSQGLNILAQSQGHIPGAGGTSQGQNPPSIGFQALSSGLRYSEVSKGSGLLPNGFDLSEIQSSMAPDKQSRHPGSQQNYRGQSVPDVRTFEDDRQDKADLQSQDLELLDFGLGSELDVGPYYQNAKDPNIKIESLLVQPNEHKQEDYCDDDAESSKYLAAGNQFTFQGVQGKIQEKSNKQRKKSNPKQIQAAQIQNACNRDAEIEVIPQSNIENQKQNLQDFFGAANDQNNSHYEILDTHDEHDDQGQINIMINPRPPNSQNQKRSSARPRPESALKPPLSNTAPAPQSKIENNHPLIQNDKSSKSKQQLQALLLENQRKIQEMQQLQTQQLSLDFKQSSKAMGTTMNNRMNKSLHMKQQKHNQPTGNWSASGQQLVRKLSQQRSRSITYQSYKQNAGSRAQTSGPQATANQQKQNKSQLMLRSNSGMACAGASGNASSSLHQQKSLKLKGQHSVNMDTRKMSTAVIVGNQSQNVLGSAATQIRRQASLYGGSEQHQAGRPHASAKNGGRNTSQTRPQARNASQGAGTGDRKSKSPSRALKQKNQSGTSKMPPRAQRPQTAKAQQNPGNHLKHKLSMVSQQYHSFQSNQVIQDSSARQPQLNNQSSIQAISGKPIQTQRQPIKGIATMSQDHELASLNLQKQATDFNLQPGAPQQQHLSYPAAMLPAGTQVDLQTHQLLQKMAMNAHLPPKQPRGGLSQLKSPKTANRAQSNSRRKPPKNDPVSRYQTLQNERQKQIARSKQRVKMNSLTKHQSAERQASPSRVQYMPLYAQRSNQVSAGHIGVPEPGTTVSPSLIGPLAPPAYGHVTQQPVVRMQAGAGHGVRSPPLTHAQSSSLSRKSRTDLNYFKSRR